MKLVNIQNDDTIVINLTVKQLTGILTALNLKKEEMEDRYAFVFINSLKCFNDTNLDGLSYFLALLETHRGYMITDE